MIKNKTLAAGLLVLPSLVALASLTAVGVMYQRVRAFDSRHQCNVLAGLAPADVKSKCEPPENQPKPDETKDAARPKPAPAAPAATEPDEPEKVVLEVDHVEYDGERMLEVVFSERPDMEVVRRYVRVEPAVTNGLSFRYQARYNRDMRTYEPVLRITGEYAYQTNVTLRILKGLPLYGKGANPTAEGSLAEDFEYVFRRNAPKPSVAFADSGRYLPPGGRQALRVEAISVTNIATAIWRVAPKNVVQLLAREEGVYRSRTWMLDIDDEDTSELAGACETGTVRCVNRVCEMETRLFPITMNDGGPQRGIFLTAVRSNDRPQEDDRDSPDYNPSRYRLVCLSDLGLSVRQGTSALGVWVTSLTSGKPVASAQVEVYSSANILVAEGSTDGNGWCQPKRCAKGEPFAVVVVAPETQDMTFMALRDSMKTDETYADGTRPNYLEPSETDVFIWTERGIYRHDERIFVHALVRNWALKAPKPLPLVLSLMTPKGDEFASKTLMTDADGSLSYDGFAVPAEQPSGKWTVRVGLPGKDGKTLARKEVKVEEFAPPQIRVSVQADETQHPSNFNFRIAAEHLFGGPARSLSCEGAVVFEDVPFAPTGWKGFTFGNDQLGLKPCFRRLSQRTLDEKGCCTYAAPLWADSGRPKAAVRATGQGVVFEDGGRPATARKAVVCHYYPFYVGCNLPGWLKRPQLGNPKITLVCVDPRGCLYKGVRQLVGKIERVDSVYSYKQCDDGTSTWNCDRVNTTVQDQIAISVNASGQAEYALPITECGDYVFTATDPQTGASFGRTFYLSDWGDDVVRAPLSNPTEVTIQPDRSFYRVGERPRLAVKAPFAGFAVLTVMHKETVYSEILNLTNATSEIILRPVERSWAPNVDVSLSVVQSVAANARHLAARAHGLATVRVRPAEHELDVSLATMVDLAHGKGSRGTSVAVDIQADGATAAVVTLVDEGINLLTGEEAPNPIRWLTRPRTAEHPLFDMYGRILPVADDGLKVSGVKTGGGFGAEMLGRISPVPTRRFKPLALWQAKVEIQDGKGHTTFTLPEFVGEVRVTAVAYSATATGAASVRAKVTPKLVMQPDAPRFVAPEDAFDVTLPLRNCSGRDGDVEYAVESGERTAGRVRLTANGATNVVVRLRAPQESEEMTVRFAAGGFGERHETALLVPVRPAVAWRETAGVMQLAPGQDVPLPVHDRHDRYRLTLNGTRAAELVAALEWLAAYPHGCLEQTCSRIFPLITAGGILNSVASKGATNRTGYVKAGVRRVESMIRQHDFVMWPDCTYAPWDREVSLYAAHFLVEAEKSGQKLLPQSKDAVMGFLKRWALDDNTNVSAYACQTLALAGCPERDRMFRLYDAKESLNALSRARLARAFAAIRDVKRAQALMRFALEPQSVKEAAFIVLALVDLNPDDPRIPALVEYLTAHRDRTRFSWGTTAENAHALLAIGAYYQHHPFKPGEPLLRYSGTDLSGNAFSSTLSNRESRVVRAQALSVGNAGAAPAFLSWRRQSLPNLSSVTNDSNGIFVSRRFLGSSGEPVDLGNLIRGEMLVAELTITSDVTRVVGDLVVEDLFAGAFEPVHRELDPGDYAEDSPLDLSADGWVMRKDARDDRMLVFSKRFELRAGSAAKVRYPVRVVSAGEFVLPGPSAEGMYNPELRSVCAPSRIRVR